MVERVRLLQAEIKDTMAAIEEAFRQLDELGAQTTNSQQDIVIGY